MRRRFIAAALVSGGGDAVAPTVATFTVINPAIGTTITITGFTASEAGTSFLITESNVQPLPNAEGWSETAPTEYLSTGCVVLYPWVKDAAGNVSAVYDSPITVDVYEAPAYANVGGTGDRRTTIVASTTLTTAIGGAVLLVDGGFSSGMNYAANDVSGKEIKFTFTTKRLITEVKWYANKTATHGTWKWWGSLNGTDWVDLSANFTFGVSIAGSVVGDLSANVTGYYYYRVLGVSGNINTTTYEYEAEFKIGNLINP